MHARHVVTCCKYVRSFGRGGRKELISGSRSQFVTTMCSRADTLWCIAKSAFQCLKNCNHNCCWGNKLHTWPPRKQKQKNRHRNAYSHDKRYWPSNGCAGQQVAIFFISFCYWKPFLLLCSMIWTVKYVTFSQLYAALIEETPENNVK